jgi:general stress protein YciG
MTDKDTSNRGFGSMDDEKQRDIASKGGRAAHEKGTAHEFSSEEASEAGRKGGEHSHGGQGHGGSSQHNRTTNQPSNTSTRGGSSEQHSEAGRQSHKNS